MTTSKPHQPSYKVHKIVEYIRYKGNFVCELDELKERGTQEILQEDYDIYMNFTDEEKQLLKDELHVMALENEVREAKYLSDKIRPSDEGEELLHSNPIDIYSKRTTYKVYYSYPVDENLRLLPKARYPAQSST